MLLLPQVLQLPPQAPLLQLAGRRQSLAMAAVRPGLGRALEAAWRERRPAAAACRGWLAR